MKQPEEWNENTPIWLKDDEETYFYDVSDLHAYMMEHDFGEADEFPECVHSRPFVPSEFDAVDEANKILDDVGFVDFHAPGYEELLEALAEDIRPHLDAIHKAAVKRLKRWHGPGNVPVKWTAEDREAYAESLREDAET